VAEPLERMIVVSGEATVRRVPDLAVVSLTVSVRDRQTAPARDGANRRASAILARLREIGVPEADIQASSLTVQPTYDHGRGAPKVTGYQASRPITVRVRDIGLLGTILDGLADDGATQVHGSSMELADPEAASREALAAAVGVARSRAEALASAAGLTLGAPRRIEEDADGSPAPFRGSVTVFRAVAESAPTEIADGEIEISARLRAWFDLE
jgi:hypothetical protein